MIDINQKMLNLKVDDSEQKKKLSNKKNKIISKMNKILELSKIAKI